MFSSGNEWEHLWSTRNCHIIKAADPILSPRLSVVVPNFNTAPFVIEAIESILRQTIVDLEVIVVDDGSTDDSIDRIVALNDHRITLVAQANRGLAGARNTGIILARAPLIGFCDSDDVWYENKAEMQIAVLDCCHEVGLTFSYSEYLTEDGEKTGQFLVTRCNEPSAFDLVARNHIGNGSTPIIRRDAIVIAGLFDESLILRDEDIEMWVRILATTPYKARLIPRVLTGYRIRKGSLSNSFEGVLATQNLVVENYRSYVHGLTERDICRYRAEGLRIFSRKAFASGQLDCSRTLLLAAIKQMPTLVLRDIRALGLLALHVIVFPLPAASQQWVYRVMQRVAAASFFAHRRLAVRNEI